MSHLELLEAQAIDIIREVEAQFDNQFMLYYFGIDSAYKVTEYSKIEIDTTKLLAAEATEIILKIF